MSTKHLLVIDDEADVRLVVQSCLEDLAGWEVITAASGQEGLVKVAANPPDAIILDMMMPGMDGLTFLEVLRTQPEGLDIPVILLTAKTGPVHKENPQKLDVEGIIYKPFEPFNLVSLIATFLDWPLDIFPNLKAANYLEQHPEVGNDDLRST